MLDAHCTCSFSASVKSFSKKAHYTAPCGALFSAYRKMTPAVGI